MPAVADRYGSSLLAVRSVVLDASGRARSFASMQWVRGIGVFGVAWALAACGGEGAKRQPASDDDGGADAETGASGGAAGSGGRSGSGGAPTSGGVSGSGNASGSGGVGPPELDGGDADAEAGAVEGGSGGSEAGTPSEPILTTCEPPIVFDDAPETAITTEFPTIFQTPTGPTFITWREGSELKGRLLNTNSIGYVFDFGSSVTDNYHPDYVSVGPSTVVAMVADLNAGNAVGNFYDIPSDDWIAEGARTGLHRSLQVVTSTGSTLHVVTDYVGSVLKLQERSKAGTWGAEAPFASMAPDRMIEGRFLLDAQDRGVVIAHTGQTTDLLRGYVVRAGAVVAEASVAPLPTQIIGTFLTALLPNGDAIAVWSEAHAGAVRTSTLTYGGGNTATWTDPVTLPAETMSPTGLTVSPNGDVTFTYSGLEDHVLRRIDGVWAEPTNLPKGEAWLANPAADAKSNVFIVRRDNLESHLEIYSTHAGETAWSVPVDVLQNAFPWTEPQRPRIGIHPNGFPVIAWAGSNDKGGRDILLSICR